MGQLLAALSMNLSPLTQNGHLVDMTSRKAIEESLNIIRDLTKEVRTMSHLLHPPLLDEAGLSSAVRWYIEGFAERSKIKVELEMPEDFGRLPREMETTVFRMVQECLTNIHRHSGSAVAAVCISQSNSEIHVEIRDQGKGISPAARAQLDIPGKAGVGVRGMRERLRQLGGTLEVDSPADGRGTIFSAHVPFRHACTATVQ